MPNLRRPHSNGRSSRPRALPGGAVMTDDQSSNTAELPAIEPEGPEAAAAVAAATGALTPPRGNGPWLRRLAGGAALFPLVVLTLLYFFDEFDTAAFGVLAPDIEKAFRLTDQRFGFIVVLNLTFVLLLAIPVGFLGDRVPRRLLVVFSGVLAGVFSFMTGVVGSVVFLVGVRMGNGVGNLANSSIHPS